MKDSIARAEHATEGSAVGRRNLPRRIPLWLKVAYSVFVAVLVPYYWRAYTPWNFLYFCDVALMVTLIALWTESRLLVSLEAVAILLPQTIWVIDFLVRATGHKLLGMTDYMFNPSLPLTTRALSLFHGWLPILLVYLLIRLGYDRRAFAWQSVIGVALLLLCFFVAPKSPAPADHPNMAVNVNYVWGPDDHHPQTWMPPAAFVAMLCGIFVVGIYLPTHWVLRWVFPPRVAMIR
jgi:hypothetical protein